MAVTKQVNKTHNGFVVASFGTIFIGKIEQKQKILPI